jgi:hypothetical protein
MRKNANNALHLPLCGEIGEAKTSRAGGYAATAPHPDVLVGARPSPLPTRGEGKNANIDLGEISQ